MPESTKPFRLAQIFGPVLRAELDYLQVLCPQSFYYFRLRRATLNLVAVFQHHMAAQRLSRRMIDRPPKLLHGLYL